MLSVEEECPYILLLKCMFWELNLNSKMKAYIELLRVHNLLGTALGVLSGVVALGIINIIPLIIAILSACMIAAAGYAINDYFDIEIDKINKPNRPLPSGRISPREALLLSYLMFIIGVIIALPIGIITTLFALVNAILMYYYSKTLKKTGLIGNLVVAFSTSATLFYGALAVAEWLGALYILWRIVPLVLMVFVLTLAREIVKGVEDVIGDSKAGVKTLAVTKGVDFALRTSLILTFIAIFLGILSYFTLGMGLIFLTFIIAGGILSIYSILDTMRSDNPIIRAARARRAMKIAMFLGLLGILLDRGLAVPYRTSLFNKN